MMNSDLSKRSRRLFGLIGAGALAACVLVSYLGIQQSHPGSTYLEATFGRAGQGLDQQSDVKIRGINVGKVASVKLDKNGKVLVRIRLNDGIKAPTTSSLSIQPLSIFGPKFIDLDPGTEEGTGPYLADGARVAKTTDPQELTDIAQPTYDLLNAIEPQDVATLLETFSHGLDGRGPALAGTLDNTAALLDLSTKDAGNLKSLIGNSVPITGTLAAKGTEIVDLARDLNLLSPAISADPAAFRSMITGAGTVSDQVVALLKSDPQGPGRILDAIMPALKVSYDLRANTPQLISGVGAFFDQSSGILQVPGPQPGTLLGTETVHIDIGNPICSFILGLCSQYPKPLPYPGNSSKGGK
jgi:phospholipid/cholesterol/gamma-HCH transport system substrate-binding protein